MTSTFGPTVAGHFYPAEQATLAAMVAKDLANAVQPEEPIASGRRVVGVIAPHAGYIYSGNVAGFAYGAIATSEPRTLVLLGPSHHSHTDRACTLAAETYRTPIGDVQIATDAVRRLLDAAPNLIKVQASIFAPEHSLDVQFPFICKALPQARVVPIIVPHLPESRLIALAQALQTAFAKDPSALVVVSSDLSHFFPYDNALAIDSAIIHEIQSFDTSSLYEQHDDRSGPCGVAPIIVALHYLKSFSENAQVHRLKYMNSGDAHGGRDRVVGYAALAMSTLSSN